MIKLKEIEILFSERVISDRVIDLGQQISQDLQKKGITQIIVLGILKGSFIFMADLVRQLKVPSVHCEFLGVSSYGDATKSSGEVKITHDLTRAIKDHDLLLVEDIADTGLTLSYLQKTLFARGAKSIHTAVFLTKPEKIINQCKLDYVGFDIGPEFVVGYGLDAGGEFRNLPFVGKIPTVVK